MGSAVFGISGCLTSQDTPENEGGVEDPPVNTGDNGGSSGSTSQGGNGGEDTGGSGGRGGSSGSGGSGGNQSGTCSEDADCEARPDRSRCSVPTGDCVECLTVSDCDGNAECVNNACRPITTCSSTDDCPQNLVCNTSTDRCVQCFGGTGCAAGDICVTNSCRKPCTNDNQCVLFGLRCDTSNGYCASCVGDDDCADDHNCQQGSCVRDICVQDSGSCSGNSITTCNEDGSQLTSPSACATRSTCVEEAGSASCEDWICEPGQTGCSPTEERVVSCSEDGLEETLVDDCAAMDQICIGAGECSDSVCDPSTRFCQTNTIQQCDSTGSSFSLYQTCTTGQLCNPQTIACAVPLCSPGQAACDGNVFTTCNAQGFGYTGTRTDCSTSGQICTTTGCTSSSGVDTIPPMNPTLYTSGALSNYLMVNFFSATTNRTLVRIENYMNPASAMTLTWQVFESTTQTGTYTSISTTTTTSTTGVGYQSSPTLSIPLVAGRFYAIGYSWTTPALVFGYQAGAASQVVAFGSLLGAAFPTTPGATTVSGSSMTTTYYLPQRLTTVPPAG
ncbi:MAG TPA: hypothetical protein VFZ53_04630 [Polyangiaceae bacterium]